MRDGQVFQSVLEIAGFQALVGHALGLFRGLLGAGAAMAHSLRKLQRHTHTIGQIFIAPFKHLLEQWLRGRIVAAIQPQETKLRRRE